MKIVEEFRDYLQTLGYSEQISYELPNTIQRILLYFKEEHQKSLSKISQKDLEAYLSYLQNTKSQHTKRYRSTIQLNSYVYALKHFSKFLYQVKNQQLTVEQLQYFKSTKKKETKVLTIEEVKQLFEVTNDTKYGLRDKAMLTIFYSCGLRRNEGVHLELQDIDFRRNYLRVRKGKYNKQRIVPFTEESAKHLKRYISQSRPQLMKKSQKRSYRLFINKKGEAMKGYSLLIQLQQLAKRVAIEKIGLHTLRHSIATHLLEKGMEIETIQQFLGHQGLESTQIYTHIQNDAILQPSIQSKINKSWL